MADKILRSVGVDIGTTTTQLIFSRLTIADTAGFGALPRMVITDKQIDYYSPVIFTPLIDGNRLDVNKLRQLLHTFFVDAGVRPEEVNTGAVIITGESARKENAREAVDALAGIAGDFVVATAGPDLESLLAGAGAGAQRRSQNGTWVLNFDIGGGTTNAALFYNGQARDHYALDIGGRLVRMAQGRIVYVSDRLQALQRANGLSISVGDTVDWIALQRLAEAMAAVIWKLAHRLALSEEERTLFIGHGSDSKLPAEVVMCSGGVAELIDDAASRGRTAALARFGDIGPLLGKAIGQAFTKGNLALTLPDERIRATVIGAGSHSLCLSGSTVFFDEAQLPIKNLPVADLYHGRDEDYTLLADKAREALQLYDDNRAALYFQGPSAPDYATLRQIAAQLATVVSEGSIVLIAHDFAKALGQALCLLGKRGVICLDSVSLAHGDYIDLGRPVAGVVPLVVKTLICQ